MTKHKGLKAAQKDVSATPIEYLEAIRLAIFDFYAAQEGKPILSWAGGDDSHWYSDEWSINKRLEQIGKKIIVQKIREINKTAEAKKNDGSICDRIEAAAEDPYIAYILNYLNTDKKNDNDLAREASKTNAFCEQRRQNATEGMMAARVDPCKAFASLQNAIKGENYLASIPENKREQYVRENSRALKGALAEIAMSTGDVGVAITVDIANFQQEAEKERQKQEDLLIAKAVWIADTENWLVGDTASCGKHKDLHNKYGVWNGINAIALNCKWTIEILDRPLAYAEQVPHDKRTGFRPVDDIVNILDELATIRKARDGEPSIRLSKRGQRIIQELLENEYFLNCARDHLRWAGADGNTRWPYQTKYPTDAMIHNAGVMGMAECGGVPENWFQGKEKEPEIDEAALYEQNCILNQCSAMLLQGRSWVRG